MLISCLLGLCRLSNGNFLTNVITCIRGNCDNNLNTTALVGPVSEACSVAGVPIAPAVISNAELIGSSLASAASATWTGATTITSSYASAGTGYVVAVPISASSGPFGIQTITGKISTITAVSITGSKSGSSASSTASQGGSGMSTTVTATSTATAVSTQTLSSSSSPSPTSSSTSGVSSGGGGSGGANTNSQQGGKSTESPTPGSNGSPFSNEGPSVRQKRYWWLGIGISVIGVLILF